MSVIERDPDENEGWHTVGSGSELVRDDDSIIHGARWRRERDEARQQLQRAIKERDALRVMLDRLLSVALVDGYGENVRDEAEALLSLLARSRP